MRPFGLFLPHVWEDSRQPRRTHGVGDAGKMPVDTFKPDALAFGDYEVISRIAEGGMGTVYKGRHRVTGETVAIKVLSAHMAKNTVMRRRLEQEYNAAHALNHPNIVRALDFCGDD